MAEKRKLGRGLDSNFGGNVEEVLDQIEENAKEADAELWEYIVKAVTNENVTYNYLKQIMNIPCGQTYYYEKRRKFYYLLSSKI